MEAAGLLLAGPKANLKAKLTEKARTRRAAMMQSCKEVGTWRGEGEGLQACSHVRGALRRGATPEATRTGRGYSWDSPGRW